MRNSYIGSKHLGRAQTLYPRLQFLSGRLPEFVARLNAQSGERGVMHLRRERVRDGIANQTATLHRATWRGWQTTAIASRTSSTGISLYICALPIRVGK